MKQFGWKWQFGGQWPGDGLPTITVTGGTITPFSSGGVDYFEVVYSASGSFALSGPVAEVLWALIGGGATGGRTGGNAHLPPCDPAASFRRTSA